MTFGNRSTTSGWQKGGGGEEGSEGGGELKRLVCRLDGADTSERADETATFAPEGERATERRRKRGRDAHKDVLRYITVNKQLDRQTEGGTDLQKGRR